MPKFSIIIPVCGEYEMTKKCVEAIQSAGGDYEIIIVDNGSAMPALEGAQIVRLPKNEGFPKAVNIGIKNAIGENICILNNDVVVSKNWLEHLAEHLVTNDIVGPVTNKVSGLQIVPYIGTDKQKDIDEYAQKVYRGRKGAEYLWHRVVFFCVVIKKKVIDDIGVLDEQFSPGNFEDDDFCLRAVEAGYKIAIADDVFVYHYGSKTHKALKIDYEKLLRINFDKFMKKWPKEKQKRIENRVQAMKSAESEGINPSIALVMFVKNEAKGLRDAVKSAQNICNEIYITVDKNSSDETLKIAKQITKNVKEFEFKDDFAEARNFAHAEVKEDWILYLDGHETIENPRNVFKYLKTTDDGILTRVRMDNGILFPACRVYRRGCMFLGAIHEQLNCKSTTLAPDIIIQHNRVCGQSWEASEEREKQRNKQMPEIMGKQIRENKKDTRAAFHLSLFYQSRGEWKKARKFEKLYIKYSDAPGGVWYMWYNIALGFLARKKYWRAWRATQKAIEINPYRWEIAEMRGLILYYKKQWQEAAEYFVESFNPNKGDVSFQPKERNLAGTWNFIGECLFNQGQYFQAGEAFNEAAKNSKDEILSDILKKRGALMFDIAREK